jgi:SsrA-binding protein
VRIVATNRKARHDYHILETLEAGIELVGSEVKSLRAGKVSLKESYGRVENWELFLHGLHISPYNDGSHFNPDPTRPRKLLVHKAQIGRLYGKTQEKGLTLVPLRIYFNDRGFAKVELALARGKRKYDKREAIRRREAEREARAALKYRG